MNKTLKRAALTALAVSTSALLPRTAAAVMDGRGSDIVPVTAVFRSSASVADPRGMSSPRLTLAENVAVSSEPAAALGGGVRISTNVYIVGFSSASVYYGDGSRLTGISSSGDGLGGHTATQALDMNGKDVVNVASITVSGGQIVGKTASDTDLDIDFAAANFVYTSASCGAATLHNMKNGGSYTLAVQGAVSGTCTFTAYSGIGTTGALSVHAPPDNGATIADTHTIYTFVVLGTHVYASWIPGY